MAKKIDTPIIKKTLDLDRDNYEEFQRRYKHKVAITATLASMVNRYIEEVLKIGDGK